MTPDQLSDYARTQEARALQFVGDLPISEQHYISLAHLRTIKALHGGEIADLKDRLGWWQSLALLLACLVIGESIAMWMGGR